MLLDYEVTPVPLYENNQPHELLHQLITKNKTSYQSLLNTALQFAPFFTIIKDEKQKDAVTDPGWNNDFVPGLDIILLYTILATHKPKQYIEIGSGTSTKVAAKAKKEQGINCTITCIDPHPRKEIKSVADEWLSEPLQQTPLSVFEKLEAGDVLFFDGSHLLHANSDVQFFFMEVLPRLKKGVIVQVHDVFLPYDYPLNMCVRFYAEQYMLATAVLSNPAKYEIVAPAFYMSKEENLRTILFPLWKQLPGVEQHGGSFWFCIQE